MSDVSYVIQIDPPSIAVNRTMLDLNNGAISVGTSGSSGTSIDWGTADFTPYEGQQGVWGQAPVDGIYPNRTITINLLLGADEAGDEEAARSDLQQKVALLQREGGQLMRQREGGPRMYADITYATLVVPDEWGESGEVEPDVQLVITALPDFYGDEIVLDTIHCTGFCSGLLEESGVQAVIEGDYPARCQITVTDTSGQPQSGVLWGFRSRHYSNASTAALDYAAAGMDPQFPAAVASLTGSYTGQVVQLTGVSDSAFQSVVALDLAGGSQRLTHVGSYAVWTRCYVQGATTELQLQWSAGGGQSNTNAPALAGAPTLNSFYVLNLGTVRLDPVPSDLPVSANWDATISAMASTTGATISIDQIWLVPLDEASGVAVGGAGVVMDANGPAYLRHDDMYYDASGSAAQIPLVIGDLARVPPSGMESRPVQLFVKPSLGQLGIGPGGSIETDAGVNTFTVQVTYRPCWLSRP